MTQQYGQFNANVLLHRVRTVSVATQATTDDGLIVCSNDSVITLPDATQIPGFSIAVKSTAPGDQPTVDGLGAQTIDGGASILLTAQNSSRIFMSDGSNWQIIAGYDE